MSRSLGSVFDAIASEGARGPDLVFRARVPRGAVGDPRGVDVDVPLRLETDDGIVVDRAVNPADAPGRIRVHIPDDATFPIALRLRGMGGVVEGGGPGDLILQIDVADTLVPAERASGVGTLVLWGGVVGAIVLGWATCA